MCATCGCTPAEHAALTLRASDLDEGEVARLDVSGTAIAVANVEGSFYAFRDECTHMSCPLSDGDLEATVITCLCHGSQFDVTTGEVVEGPATAPLETFKTLMEGDQVQVQVQG